MTIPDSMGIGVGLTGIKKWKPASGGEIVYCQYIPYQRVETDEQREARLKRERANKRFAKVKLSNANAYHRGKRGQIMESGNGKSCLEIETINSCTPSGCHTLVGVIYPHGYEKIWFDDSELENFESYDGEGNLMQ